MTADLNAIAAEWLSHEGFYRYSDRRRSSEEVHAMAAEYLRLVAQIESLTAANALWKKAASKSWQRANAAERSLLISRAHLRSLQIALTGSPGVVQKGERT